MQRQTTLLAVLVLISIAAFFLTRALAGAAHHLHESDADQWHELGAQRLEAGDVPGAITAMRHAAAMRPDSREVQFSLAAAYQASGQMEAARNVLLELRELRPDDAEVNLRLATLQAARGETEEAIRHYQATLLSLWGPDQLERRRSLRGDYIEFLLERGLTARALSESLLLAGELPKDLPSYLRMGDLLLRAGDPERALEQFELALSLEARHPEALARAGEAAFESGDFRLANRYLSRAPATPRTQERRAVAEAVLAFDPLMPRLATRERHRRIVAAADRLAAEIARCRETCAVPDPRCAPLDPLAEELAAARKALSRNRTAADSIDDGLSTVTALAARTAEVCGGDATILRALAVIARQHGVGQ